jgi:hypothetical protein
MAARAGVSGTESAAASGSGSMGAVAGVSGNGLYCSETLACSDTDVTCTDADGINASTTSTGTMVPA